MQEHSSKINIFFPYLQLDFFQQYCYIQSDRYSSEFFHANGIRQDIFQHSDLLAATMKVMFYDDAL
ncbi:hypothetical protein BN2497_4101 [Janthinobacterium sp. CG23_2]|nr:hypothetical protein BN2497_4101 [Janthinobacterium sp. CG23_2]CUU28448.1 hypothetical protein BN3177_4101 [Janthinobacterium sp. CG23_2]